MYHRLQQMVQRFWQRWSAEYLTNLQQRYKWKRREPNHIQIGDLVVLKESGLPPLQWKLGRVVALHPGNDKVIRVVSAKTSTGVFKRSAINICLLPSRDTET
ncbi:hypothetical protein JTB14_014902 [Gonioctena quinquepunctata]|nr:hypothetical protein JTB14_014902 [Gonioctena quinquepunctata]